MVGGGLTPLERRGGEAAGVGEVSRADQGQPDNGIHPTADTNGVIFQ